MKKINPKNMEENAELKKTGASLGNILVMFIIFHRFSWQGEGLSSLA